MRAAERVFAADSSSSLEELRAARSGVLPDALTAASLANLAIASTGRVTTEPAFLNWAMPHYLGISHSDYTHIPWTTAHGDFHFANLCAPDLTILDWEGWGLAPPGYDAATLHCYSLLDADTAPQIRRELAHLLTHPGGTYATLAVTAELLHAAAEGTHTELAEPLRRFARSTLTER
jgi:thiamine kinase-like enzyme